MEKRRRFSEEEKKQIVSGWSASGLNKRSYCAKLGVSPSNFYFWLKRYSEPINEDLTTEGYPERFIPVNLASNSGQEKQSATASPIELTFPGGVHLRCTSDVDFEELRKLIY